MRGRPEDSLSLPSDLSGSTRAIEYKPVCLTLLTGNARVAFDMLVEDLWETGSLDSVSPMDIATAAMHYGAAMTAQEIIDKLGVVYPVTRGARDGNPGYKVIEANPACKQLHDSLRAFSQCAPALGFRSLQAKRAKLR